MNRFTIVTMILAVSVITVMSDLVARDYLARTSGGQANQGEASVIQADPIPSEAAGVNVSNGPKNSAATSAQTSTPTPAPTSTSTSAPENQANTSAPLPATSGSIEAPAPKLTEQLIFQAGFAAAKEDHFDGKLYELLDITKNPVDGIVHYQVSDTSGVVIATITEITLADEIRALQLYLLLQNKTKPYIDLSLNETNAYGDRSFYINHAKKIDQAFLTVKIGSRIYAIAYLKVNHDKVKQLITLLAA